MNPLERFERLDPGVWRCLRDCQLDVPTGKRIQFLKGSIFRVGRHTYMDLDVAAWLERTLALELEAPAQSAEFRTSERRKWRGSWAHEVSSETRRDEITAMMGIESDGL